VFLNGRYEGLIDTTAMELTDASGLVDWLRQDAARRFGRKSAVFEKTRFLDFLRRYGLGFGGDFRDRLFLVSQ